MPCTFFLFTTFTWRKFLVKHEIWNGTNTHTYTYRHIRIKRRMLSANTGCSTFDNVITSLQPTAATTMVIRARHFLFLIFYVLFSSLFHMFVPLKNRTPPKDKSNAWIMNERLLQKKKPTKRYVCRWVSVQLIIIIISQHVIWAKYAYSILQLHLGLVFIKKLAYGTSFGICIQNHEICGNL